MAMLIREGQSLQESSFPSPPSRIHQDTLLELLGGPVWTQFGVPKSMPKRSRSHLEHMLLEHCIVEVFQVLQEYAGRFPGTPPPSYQTSVGPRQNHHFGPIVDRGVQNSMPGFHGPPSPGFQGTAVGGTTRQSPWSTVADKLSLKNA